MASLHVHKNTQCIQHLLFENALQSLSTAHPPVGRRGTSMSHRSKQEKTEWLNPVIDGVC